MATGTYVWKDKPLVAGAKDPTAPATAQTPGQPTSGGSMFGTTPTFGDMVKDGPAASSPTPSFNDLFAGMGDTRAQNLQGAQQAIGQGLDPSTPSAGSQVARNSFIKAQTEAARQNAEASALANRDETGQLVGDRREYMNQTLLPQRMDFEAQLQAQEEGQAETRRQNAVGNVLAMEGLGSQERQTDKGLTESARQFDSRQEFEEWATKGGWDQDAIARAWQSGENKADREVTVSEGALGRELTKYLGDRGLDIDEKQLGETIRQFDGKMAFDKWATEGGWDQQDKDRIWDAHLQDLSQKWQSGERLGAQDHQALIEDKRIKAQTAAQEFDKLTQLEVLGKTQEWDKAKLELNNTYQTLRDTQAMSHEQAMTVLKGDIETRLTAMGIDATAARQAAEIEANKWTTEREIAHQSAVANAELLYKYDSLREQSGLAREELALKAKEITNQSEQFLKSFGLDERRVESMINSQEMQDAIGINTLLLEMAGDNPDMIDLASENFLKAIGGIKGPDGQPTFSKVEIDNMIAAMQQPDAPANDTLRTMDGVRQWRDGIEGVKEGDIIGGGVDLLQGGFKATTSVPADVGSAVVSGVKKIFKNPFG